MPEQLAHLKNSLLITVLSIALAACGGGGGGSSITPATPVATTPSASTICTDSSGTGNTPSLSLATDCSGTNCGSINSTDYLGTGVGIWSGFNNTSSTATASVYLTNVTGKSVTLLWSNLGNSNTVSAPATNNVVGSDNRSSLQTERLAAAQASFRQQLPSLLKKTSINALLSTPAISPLISTGSPKTWYDYYKGNVDTTLRSQASLSDGNKVNIWVQNSEWDPAGGNFKVTQAMADLLRDKFAASQSGIFDMVTTLTGGQPWGSHSHTGTMISAPQDIQIVIANLTPDLKPAGLVGYFFGYNNVLKSTAPYYANSNEALMFFVDSETLASPTNSSHYQAMMVSGLAHEFVHMINFYQRTAQPSTDRSFDTWLEETSAMMAEDIVDKKLDPSYHELTDNWFPGWVNSGASSNCSLTDYVSSGACFSYNLGGSYGGYLLRQYGLNFYKDLLQSTDTNSITALTNTIKKYDISANFEKTVRRWGTAIALLDSSTLPAGFGYPERTDTVGSTSYTLPAINGPDFASYRYIAPLPTALKPYAHAVQSCTSNASSYNKKVLVPASTALTVIVN